MLTLENLKKIAFPIHKNQYISHEHIKGKWDNIQWLFNIYRNKNFKKGKNLVSVSYFLLMEIDEVYSFARGKSLQNYQKNHIEKIKIYNRGINDIIKKSARSDLDITVRVYCDFTTINILQRFLKFPNVELYYYFVPKFFDTTRLSHIGFFGTVMRYLPLFNLKNHNENDWETVTISDIDTIFLTEYALLSYYVKNPKLPNIMFKNRACYYVSSRILAQDLPIPEISVISSFIIQRDTQDSKIFFDFLQNCLLDGCDIYKNAIGKYLPFNLKERPMQGRLEYGVDEYFMNVFFIPKCYLDKNLPIAEAFVADKYFGVNSWLFIVMSDKDLKIKNPKLMEEFLYFVAKLFFPVGYKFPKYKDVKELINIVGDKFYNDQIYRIQFPIEKYEAVENFVKKHGPEELNMDPRIMSCFKRGKERYPDSTVIKIVYPDPKYPKFIEKTVDIIPHKNKHD